MRKKLLFLLTIISLFTLAGCFSSKKEFSASGITITLPDSFREKEVIQAPLYLESTQHIFIGLRESKADLRFNGIITLEDYIQAVLDANGKTGEVEEYDEGDVHYFYAYYTSSVDGQDFGYMLIVMEGENYLYSMNFGCREKNLEKNKAQYKEWAKTIVVE